MGWIQEEKLKVENLLSNQKPDQSYLGKVLEYKASLDIDITFLLTLSTDINKYLIKFPFITSSNLKPRDKIKFYKPGEREVEVTGKILEVNRINFHPFYNYKVKTKKFGELIINKHDIFQILKTGEVRKSRESSRNNIIGGQIMAKNGKEKEPKEEKVDIAKLLKEKEAANKAGDTAKARNIRAQLRRAGHYISKQEGYEPGAALAKARVKNPKTNKAARKEKAPSLDEA